MWVLAVTSPRSEVRVADTLAGIGISSQVFKYKMQSVYRGKQITKTVVAFSRYVFVDVIEDWMWRTVREVKDVINFACGDDQVPWVLPPKQILDLQARVVEASDILPYIGKAKFNFGDKVWVSGVTSVVSGRFGVYQYPTSLGKSCILQDWMGRMVPVEIYDNDIEVYQPRWRRRSNRKPYQRKGSVAEAPQLNS